MDEVNWGFWNQPAYDEKLRTAPNGSPNLGPSGDVFNPSNYSFGDLSTMLPAADNASSLSASIAMEIKDQVAKAVQAEFQKRDAAALPVHAIDISRISTNVTRSVLGKRLPATSNAVDTPYPLPPPQTRPIAPIPESTVPSIDEPVVELQPAQFYQNSYRSGCLSFPTGGSISQSQADQPSSSTEYGEAAFPQVVDYSFPCNDIGPPHDATTLDSDIIPTALTFQNIPFIVRKGQLLAKMQELGLPHPYAFNYHFDHGVFRGIAFADYSTAEDANLVLGAMNSLELMGRKLRVKYKRTAPPAEQKPVLGDDLKNPLISPRGYRKSSKKSRTNGTSRVSKRTKFSLQAIAILESWLKDHLDHPYPSKETKEALAVQCGLEFKQVSNWFSNNRKRNLSPMEQWLSSSSEDEDVVEAAIRQIELFPALRSGSSFGIDLSSQTPASVYGRSPASSIGSAFSQTSFALGSKSPRRGRRRHSRNMFHPYSSGNPSPWISPSLKPQPNRSPWESPALSAQPEHLTEDLFGLGDFSLDDIHTPSSLHPQTPVLSPLQPVSSEPSFQCTFCHKFLSEKAWKRHEETQHLPKAKWVCMAQGSTLLKDGSARCVFCHKEITLDDGGCHDHHRISDCVDRSVEERTFYRRDNLKQHLENFHGAQFDPFIADHWKKEVDYSGQRWHCGFCGEDLGADWNSRATHIAEHFRQGRTMKDWIHSETKATVEPKLSDEVQPEAANSAPRRLPATIECTLCPKKFTRAYNLRSHLRTHTDRKYVCKGTLSSGQPWGCGRGFAKADHLGCHFRSVAGKACLQPVLADQRIEVMDEAKHILLDPKERWLVANRKLPYAILLRYPALATSWPEEWSDRGTVNPADIYTASGASSDGGSSLLPSPQHLSPQWTGFAGVLCWD